MKELRICLAVKETFLQGMLRFIIESYLKCEVTVASNDAEALELIKKDVKSDVKAFDFFIYDYDPFSCFIDDLKKVNSRTSKMKILVLCQAEFEQNVSHIEKTTGIKLLKKDDVPLSLIRYICSQSPSSEILNDSAYCRMPVELLVRFEGIRKNLYLKIGEGKMVQIFKEEEKTESQDILKYHKKGVNFLYLKRATAEALITQIQRQIKVFLKSNNFKFVLGAASDTSESLFEQRIIRMNNEIFIDDEFHHIVLETINQLKPKILKEKRIDLFMSHLMGMPNHFEFFSKKVELTSMFAITFMKKLNWVSQATSEKIIYASVLCDITLAVRPKLLQIRGIEEFNACIDDLSVEDRDYFLSHPAECSSLAAKFFQTAPTDTNVLILQHHELPDGKGFPSGIKAEKISELSAVFIIASDLAHYILTDVEPTIDEYLRDNQARWDYIHFRVVIKALSSMRQEKLKSLSE